ncbi:Xylan 1,4-beta-xylosidase [Caldicellulosiruptor kronotskyensis 2002]|uniref:Xylan 1,4-beta-xylosidase n=1 Tax=Caldicellulosiruptor kronotskyensis (strain DSM 18902 / VKM B-2412 / 2002) TaxID=632348 RepID=E4SHI2_CALK2|nr:xylan 1,4-beta-xylosidase [Caldicellulosiruptor kronotskyensis]ADQ47207.1 Xylan 1,4-beta-xylosidase [Caldicellulosiruptor kronotskyensis 2002]
MTYVKIERGKIFDVFPDNWKFCVGSGRIGLALQKEYMEALEYVKKHIDFKYLRAHGLLHDDVGIYREDNVGDMKQPFYNFTYIDRIYDSFLELGIRPFVEIGFMPSKLASGTQTVFYWRGNVTPPSDYGKWEKLIKAVVKHFIDRYGEKEVENWPFEIWNEPNLNVFWKDADQNEYFKLYEVTAKAIKDVNENIKVGGPAICGGADHWIDDFLNFCYKNNVPVDFVTRHAYTAKPPTYTPHFVYHDLHPIDYMLNEFKMVREQIKNSPFPNLPIHITEYNSSYHPLCPVHDTPFNAAYLARILSEGGYYVDSFSYWTFSDVFEEADVPRSLFHGGFGLVAFNNIPKPVFHMFTFFNAMGRDILYRDDHILVTKRADGSVAIVAWNEVISKEQEIEREYKLEIPIDFEDIFVKQKLINEEHANPWRVWIEMGRPRYPSKEQIKTLKEIAKPHVSTCRMRAREGYVTLNIKLGKNAVVLYELNKVNDETHTYIGLDDSKIPGY